MGRHLLTALSVWLFLALGVLWVRSYSIRDEVVFTACRFGLSIQSIDGHMLFGWRSISVNPWFLLETGRYDLRDWDYMMHSGASWRFAGFYYYYANIGV